MDPHAKNTPPPGGDPLSELRASLRAVRQQEVDEKATLRVALIESKSVLLSTAAFAESEGFPQVARSLREQAGKADAALHGPEALRAYIEKHEADQIARAA